MSTVEAAASTVLPEESTVLPEDLTVSPPQLVSSTPPPPQESFLSIQPIDSDAGPTTSTAINPPSSTPPTPTSWLSVPIRTSFTDPNDLTYVATLSLDSTTFAPVTVIAAPDLRLSIGSEIVFPQATPTTIDDLVISLQSNPPAVLFTPAPQSTAETQESTLQTTQSTSTAPPSDTSTNAPAPDPSISSGAIAGIAIGAVLVIALIIGGWFFWRRKKRRTQQPTTVLTEDELVRREGDGDKIVLDPHQTAPTAGAYQTEYQEMSGNGLTQELDRSQSYKHAIGGAHELKAEDQPGELPFAGAEEHGSTHNLAVDDGRGSEMAQVPQTDPTGTQAAQVSPHAEAQRRREVEWLEAEEMRMRQRREALLQQGGGQTP